MIHHRTREAVVRFDIFKLIVLLILLALLLYLSFCRAQETFSAPALTDPEAGSVLTAGSATLSGTGDAGSTVQILAGGAVLGTAVVGDDGTWSFDTNLDAGDTEFTFGTLDSAGEVAASSDPITFTVSEVMAEIETPTFSLPGTAVGLGTLALAGTGTPGSLVEIVQDGNVLGTAEVDADGNWSFDVELDEAGDFDFVVNGLDDAGEVVASSDSQAVTVEGMEIAVPTFDLPEIPLIGSFTLTGTGTPGSTVEVVQNGESLGTAVVGNDGTWSFDLEWPDIGDYDLSLNGLDADGNVVASSDAQSFTVGGIDIAAPTLDLPDLPTIGSFTFSGTGEPGSTIEIVRDGEVIGTTVVGEDGTWSFDADFPDVGDYDLTLNNLDADGNVLSSLDFPGISFSLPTTTLDFELPELGEFAAGADGLSTGQLTLNGRSAPNATIEIYANGELIGTTTADADGNWSFDEEVSLPAGSYELSVLSLDADGVVLAESDAVALEIPEVAVVTGPVPTVAAVRTGLTSDEAVMLTGTAVPGSTVEIIIGGEVVDTVVADAGGNWRSSFTLPASGYTIVARSDETNSLPLALVVADAATAGTLEVAFAPAAEEGSDGTGSAALSVVEAAPTVELILDASWSMTRGIGSVPRINIARQTMINIVNNVLPAGSPVALRAYGNIEGDFACRTDLMVPLGPLDQEAMISTIEGIQPIFNANTPIAASLAEVPNDLGDVEGETIVILLTDGEETCDGDPAAAIAALSEQGIDVRIDIVGLDIVDDALQAEFLRWSELGGGQYFNAASSAELTEALSLSLGASYLVQNEAGDGIAVGIIGGPALKLPPGTYTVQVISAPDIMLEPITIGEGETVEVVIE
ncbi:MAG: Ig-like domain-containing protein [Chloroflexota bacterium]